ncbi:MAG: glycosyltransferase family 4 protein [Methanoregula sp.]|nr:glycosyltransferase family 4 protein [Methanoregula sp.]
MKILHTVESYDPSTGGMQEVVKQISERLVKIGHSVTIATSKNHGRTKNIINGVKIEEFDITGNYVTGMKGDKQSYQDFLLHSDFDIITNFAAQQWATDLMLPLLKEIKAKKVFVPTGFSALHLPEYSDYFKRMKEWMKQYDMNVFLSNTYQDIEFARKSDVRNLTIIPNGASEVEFNTKENLDIRKDLEIPKDQFLVLNVGSHTGMKGHAEAIKIFRQANLKNATFVIVGNVFSRYCFYSCKIKELLFHMNPINHFKNKHLLVRSLTRDQTVALYKTSDLFLFPSNVECSPIVLFECLASKTPFLTTDVGNAKEIIEWSGAGVLLPTHKNSSGYSYADIKKSVKLLERLFNDPIRRATMQEDGFKKWQTQFSWETIAKQYELLYLKLPN